MTQVYLAFRNKQSGIPTGFQNSTGTYDPINTGTVIANLLDTTSAFTGLGLSVPVALPGTAGAGSWCDADIWGLNVEAFRHAWVPRNSTVNGTIRISGFSPGQTGAITLCGHANQATRHTDYFLNGGSANRYTATAKPPAQPITIAFTANASGHVDITTAYTSIQSYLNFIILDYTVATTPDIDSVDQCITGRVATITYSDDFAATSATIADSDVTKTFSLTASLSDVSTGTIPQWVDGETAVKIGAVTIKASDGTDDTPGFSDVYSMEYFHPDNATVVEFTAVELTSVSPDSLSVVMGFSPPWKVGTQVLYDATRFTVGVNGVVSGNYTGVSYMPDRDPDDKIARFTTLTTENGEIISATRLRGQKITAEKLRASKLMGSKFR